MLGYTGRQVMFINHRARTLRSEAVFAERGIGHFIVLCVSSVFPLFIVMTAVVFVVPAM